MMDEPKTATDFLGLWDLHRLIDDFASGRTGELVGHVAFAIDGHYVRYGEKGRLVIPGQRDLHAERTNYWRDASEGNIEVLFQDRRPFHIIQLTAGCPSATHNCGADRYDVEYDFSAWPDWSAIWQVKGPRKDYRTTSTYRRRTEAA
ncbi:MAG: DUF6314 family protein [Pseudomonadota bacterium]